MLLKGKRWKEDTCNFLFCGEGNKTNAKRTSKKKKLGSCCVLVFLVVKIGGGRRSETPHGGSSVIASQSKAELDQ